jgi:hypothetical protein
MGSKFIDIYVADPAEAHAVVRGERPELIAAMFAGDNPPPDELRPAFAVMQDATFCFLPKASAHPEGIHYCRAFERVLGAIGRRWGIECYPEGSLLWDLAFGHCEAGWLTLPHSESGVAVTAWRSPGSAFSIGNTARRMRESGDFEPRYVSAETLGEIAQACNEGYRSGFGIFTIYQE